MKNPEFINDLEIFIDNNSVQDVIIMLRTLCEEKATHVESTWQDRILARQWRKAAVYLDRVSEAKAITDLPL